MTDLATVDDFSDQAIAQDPYAYLAYLREQNPVFAEPHYGVVVVTGYEEAVAAFKDHDSFSAVNAIGGPFPPLPFPINELMVPMDPPAHTRARSLLSRLLTPARLQENEDFMPVHPLPASRPRSR